MLGVYTPPEALYDGGNSIPLISVHQFKLQIFELIFDPFLFFNRASFFLQRILFSYFYIEIISTQCKCPNCVNRMLALKRKKKKVT